MTVLLDTTVLSYAVGVDHPLRQPCRDLLEAHGVGVIQAATTIEVIQEFVHVRSRRRPRSDAVRLGRLYADGLDLWSYELADLTLGLTLFEQHDSLGAFDAVLAAVALNWRAAALVSADRAFGQVPGLPWLEPVGALDRLQP